MAIMKSIQKQSVESDQELHEHYRFKVDPKQSPIRIDKFLIDRMENISRNRIQNAAKADYIFVNEVPIKSNYKVRPGDEITILLPYERKKNDHIIGENIPLEVRYEDEHLMVINKPPGLVIHPGIGNHSGTLVNALVHYLSIPDLPIKEGNDVDRPGIVHRIDKDTSGLLVIAKTQDAMSGLSYQFMKHTIERKYLALVWGNFDELSGTVTANVGRHPKARLQMQAFEDGSEGKHAVTHYEVIEDLYYVSLVQCKLETGRTHQIRVHMKHLGHPLFNDWRYNGDRIWKGTVFSKYKRFVENCFEIMPRQSLHATSLGFIHPITKEYMYFEEPLPQDFADVLDKWRNYVGSRKDK